MSSTENVFEAWQAGHSAIVRRELAGLPVPHAWQARLESLEWQCRAIEDARPREPWDGHQAELFNAPRKSWRV